MAAVQQPKATPRRSPRPRKVTASGPQRPSSDSSDDDDDEEVRRLEAALAAAKAKKKRRQPLDDVTIEAIRAVAASRELCCALMAASGKELRRLAKLCGIEANQTGTVILAELEKLVAAAPRPKRGVDGVDDVEESSLPPPPAPKSARPAASGYDTLNADVLTKVLEFLPLDDAAATKQLSSTTASAARGALTRGRWRPFKTFCLDGDEQGCRTIANQSYTDQDRALFREVWALESGAVMKELLSWHPMSSTGPNCAEIEGALRFLAIVEPEPTSGFGRIVAAFAGMSPREAVRARPGILAHWSSRVHGGDQLHSGLEQGNIDLGLGAWATPKDGAAFILRLVLSFGFTYHSQFMHFVNHRWQDRRAAAAFLEAGREIAEELREIAEREAYFRRMRRAHWAAMGIPLSDSESEDDGSDSEEEEN